MAQRERWVPCNIVLRTKLCHKVHKKIRGQWYGVIYSSYPDKKPKKKGKD